MTHWHHFPSPAGPISFALSDSGALTELRFETLETNLDSEESASSHLVREQLDEYFSGTRQEFELPLDPAGTEFQHQVWKALCRIPHGSTRSYKEIAEALGRPGASRAVGRANATNPIALVVPCHRVVGSSGALTGFAYGLGVKRYLLDHEQASRPFELQS